MHSGEYYRVDKSLSRTNDVELTAGQKEALGDIMLGHAISGRGDMMALIMKAMGKTSAAITPDTIAEAIVKAKSISLVKKEEPDPIDYDKLAAAMSAANETEE